MGKKAPRRVAKSADRDFGTAKIHEPAAPRARRRQKVVVEDRDFARAAVEIGQALRRLRDLGGIDDVFGHLPSEAEGGEPG